MRQVLDTFEPVADQLDEARERWDLAVEIGLVVTMYIGTRSVDANAELLAATPPVTRPALMLVTGASLRTPVITFCAGDATGAETGWG